VTGKLRILDLALLLAAALLYWQLRREWIGSHARDSALLNRTLAAAHVAGLAPLEKVDPVTAAAFADIATKNLFSQDRNPNVIVDPPPPPPEKPQPPFPVAHGVMLWDGVPPTIVLSEKANGPQKGYHPGDTIGPWKVVSVDNSYADFEWDGKDFKKRLDELIDQTPIAQASAPAAASAAARTGSAAAASGSAPPGAGSAAPAGQPKSGAQTLSNSSHSGPGDDVGGGMKTCYADDPSPEGTVVDGLKKIVSATPFGSVCRWEPSK
jgi:hypothetical protein